MDPMQSTDVRIRAADTLEFLARIAGAGLIVWGFVAKVGKPYFEWRQRKLNEAITAVLKLSLAGYTKEITDKIDIALERQTRVFEEVDLLVVVLADNRDRMDEMKEMLDGAGFSSRNRRVHADRRIAADEAMAELQGRIRGRRRHTDDLEEERFI